VDSRKPAVRVADTVIAMASESSIATVIEPLGRPVTLTAERWSHITARHPELLPFRAEILSTVRRPTSRLPGRRPNEEWFYRRAGPSLWLKVVLAYEGRSGQIRTAFARRAYP
jgi:hypothetical protein